MTNAQYRKSLELLDLTPIRAARVFGISTRQSQRYARDYPVPGPIAKLLQLMISLKLDPNDIEAL
jgi:hypothetical protein